MRLADGLCKVAITILPLKDCTYGGVWAYPVKAKGLEVAPEVVDHFIGDLSACGLYRARIVVTNDQEPAILKVQDENNLRRREKGADETAEGNSRVGDSASNGRVERCVQDLGGQV